jgi:hypothetical protein
MTAIENLPTLAAGGRQITICHVIWQSSDFISKTSYVVKLNLNVTILMFIPAVLCMC